MPNYKYVGNVKAYDTTTVLNLSDGDSIGIGDVVSLSEDNYLKLSEYFHFELVPDKKQREVPTITLTPKPKNSQ